MILKLISSTLLIFTTSVLAQNVPVYKWVDDQGVVHFSHSYPSNKDASLVEVRVDYTPSEIIEDRKAAELAKNEAEISEQMEAKQTEENLKLMADNCKSAQANKKVLTNFEKVMVKNEDGSETLLTGESLAAQIEITDKHIDVYCNN